MVLVSSSMLALGTKVPNFNLPDVVSGEKITLDTFKDHKALLVMFICQHCPYVKHIETALARIGKDYANQPVGIVAISANDADNYPDDAPPKLKKQAEQLGFVFPYCYDEHQMIAKAFTATCTPDFFLFDDTRKLVYRGQFDDSRPGNTQPITGKDLRTALEAVLSGRSVPLNQKPSAGCNIKWKDV